MRGRRDPLAAHLAYPIRPPAGLRIADRIALRRRRDGRQKTFGPIRCTVCGRRATAVDFADIPAGLRETGRCSNCAATNRHRQLSLVLAGRASDLAGRRVRSAADVSRTDLRIHNTESAGPVHQQLVRSDRYSASEYFGPEQRSGDVVDGVMHQDLMALSFGDDSIDVLITSDVFEHVADPYRAHEEVFRVLRPGGFHVFTIPFLETAYVDERRAFVDERGELHHLAEPVYHADPVNPVPGALVFTYFSLEMLVRLAEIGFTTELYWLHRPGAGIVGQEATVFAARKPPA